MNVLQLTFDYEKPTSAGHAAASGSWGAPVPAERDAWQRILTLTGVRQESWQRTGGESPLRGKVSQPPRPRVMHEVLFARTAVKRSQGRPRAKY
jgi:hypothetical protein